MLLLQLSIFYGKASLSAIIISMNPLFVSLFALILIHEKLSRSQIVSIILGIIGLFLIILFEHDFTNMDFVNLKLGIVLAVLAALSFGIWTVLTRSAVLVYGNTFTNALSFLLGGSVLLAVNQVLGKPFMFQFSMRNVLYMAYFGCIITGAAYLLYFQGMKHINAGSASAYFFFKPVIASLLAYVLLHETLGVGQLAGTIIVISGLLIRNSQARFLRKLFTPTRPNIT